MKDKPVLKGDEILNKESKFLVMFISLFSSVLILLTFWFFWQGNPENYKIANSIAFTSFGLLTLFFMFSLRDLSKPVWKTNILSNKYLVYSFFLGFFLQVIVIYVRPLQEVFKTTALGFGHWIVIFLIAFVNILVIELVKYIFTKFKKK